MTCRRQIPGSERGLLRRAHRAVDARERFHGGLRRAQAPQGEQGAHGRRHAGHLLALHVTPANEQERAQLEALAAAVQEATGESVELVYGDQGYTGSEPEAAAAEYGIQLEAVKHTEAKKGFVLLPRRWVVERSFAWMSRFRRLERNYERAQRPSPRFTTSRLPL